jgi:hypothetical protein
MHRFLFGVGVKDRLVSATNRLSIAGLAVLSLSMVGGIVLVSDWVGGTLAAALFGAGAAVVFGAAWFALPLWMRSTDLSDSHGTDGGCD